MNLLNRPLPAPARDIALALTRTILAVVMFAHGYQKLFIQGIGRTTDGFQTMNIPLAIVSASFVTTMEVAGSVLLLAGAVTWVVCAGFLFEMVGAAVFVHASHGIFVQSGGFEYVAVISALVIALAAVGPGRYSVDHWMAQRHKQHKHELTLAVTSPATPAEPTPALPATYVPAPAHARLELPEPFAPAPIEMVASPSTEALPVRTPRPAHASR